MTEKTVRSGRRVTLKDIAGELNVSHATVSRALNSARDSMISETVRTRIREVATEMGYRPNHAGRSLVTGQTGLLALWLWAEAGQSSYQAMIAKGMYSEVGGRAHQLVIDLVSHQSTPSVVKSFDPWKADGIVAHEAGPAIQAALGGLGAPPIPLVSTGTYHFVPGADRVVIDLAGAAQAAMEHLLAAGRKRIAYVNDAPGIPAEDARYLAYRDRLEAASEVIPVRPSRDEARQAVREYVLAHGCPDAFFCHNDELALATYRALCDLKIKVPDDTAIVGCNGTIETAYLEVPITTIAFPVEKMCQVACDFLERRIREPDLPRQEARLEANLLIRPSSGGPDTWPPSQNDPTIESTL